MSRTLTVSIPNYLYEEIEDLKNTKGISRSEMVAELLTKGLLVKKDSSKVAKASMV